VGGKGWCLEFETIQGDAEGEATFLEKGNKRTLTQNSKGKRKDMHWGQQKQQRGGETPASAGIFTQTRHN